MFSKKNKTQLNLFRVQLSPIWRRKRDSFLLFAKTKVQSEICTLQKPSVNAKNLPQADFLNALVLIPLAIPFHKQKQAQSSACFVMARHQ